MEIEDYGLLALRAGDNNKYSEDTLDSGEEEETNDDDEDFDSVEESIEADVEVEEEDLSDYEDDIIKYAPNGAEYYNPILRQNVIMLGSKPNKKICSFFNKRVLLFYNLNNIVNQKNNYKEISSVDHSVLAANNTNSKISEKQEKYGFSPQKTSKSEKSKHEANIKSKQRDSKDVKTELTVTCPHCNQQFKNQEVVLDHLIKVAKSKPKEEFVKNLRRNSEFKIETTNTNIFEDNPNDKKQRKASLPIHVTLKPSKVDSRTEISRSTNTQHNVQTVSGTDSTKTDKTTHTSIKIKFKLKNSVANEYEIEKTEENLKDVSKKDLSMSNNLDIDINPKVNKNNTDNSNYKDIEIKTHKSNSIVNNVTNKKNVIKLPQAKTSYSHKDQSKLCKIKPFMVRTQTKSSNIVAPIKTSENINTATNKSNNLEQYVNKADEIKCNEVLSRKIENSAKNHTSGMVFNEKQTDKQQNVIIKVNPISKLDEDETTKSNVNKNLNSELNVATDTNNVETKKSKLNEDKITFFKCHNCSTHFLRRIECITHIKNFRNKNGVCDKNNIACKNCSLLFSEKGIDLHMRKHHDNNNVINQVLIIEYEFDEKHDYKITMNMCDLKEDVSKDDTNVNFFLNYEEDYNMYTEASFSKIVSEKFLNSIVHKESYGNNNNIDQKNNNEAIKCEEIYDRPSKRLRFEDS